MDYKKENKTLEHTLSMPFVYFLIVPVIFFDILLEVYHNVCFRLYGIPLVERSKYIKIDRHKLSYLSYFDKFNCAYCGYVGGFIQYTQEIFWKTEEYWCGIKHASDDEFIEPEYHQDFIDYGDEEKYKKISKK